ncbi:phosphatase PAP2 family protein [Shewanella sp. UCD-KL12]|uniref:phosphatase PAP2 family protein n=1 Tax=Shewanella sp. UCD-KL12 TaxID=1917163 RepID=UPI0009702987|nr:phosphatase PAP2 family protein [Shewanella sp. UCD-KL12]
MFSRLVRFDRQVFLQVFERSQGRASLIVARQISRSGDGPFYLLLVLTLLICSDKGSSLFSLVLSAFLIELPLYLLLKNVIKRTRPCHLYLMANDKVNPTASATLTVQTQFEPSDKFSLPSGHTAAAFLVASSIHLVYPDYSYIAFVWGAMIGLSRIALGVHYPLDILAGIILGVSSVTVVANIVGY